MAAALETLVYARGNRPQIRSKKWFWPDVLVTCYSLGVVSERQGNVARVWPWGNRFAKAISAADRDAPVLQGRMHPKDFRPLRDSGEDLPPDPLVRWKRIKDILEMRAKGELQAEMFGSAAEDAPHLKCEAGRGIQVHVQCPRKCLLSMI
jgi:hypothetical protein